MMGAVRTALGALVFCCAFAFCWFTSIAPLRAASDASDLVHIGADEPRPFGYVIGDLVERVATIELAQPYRLVADSIPKTGRQDAWLELRGANLVTRTEPQSTRYRLALTYQIMNVRADVQTIELPPLKFGFDGEHPFAAELAGWPITVAPLTPDAVLAQAGLEEMRADRSPPLIDTHFHRVRLWLYGALFAVVLFTYVYTRFGPALLARKPFARACRQIGKLKKNGTPDAYNAALRALHRAFDATSGATVFFEYIDAFLTRHPRFAGLRVEIERFFLLSRDQFFGAQLPNASPRQSSNASPHAFLRSFCRAMRECEAARNKQSPAK